MRVAIANAWLEEGVAIEATEVRVDVDRHGR